MTYLSPVSTSHSSVDGAGFTAAHRLSSSDHQGREQTSVLRRFRTHPLTHPHFHPMHVCEDFAATWKKKPTLDYRVFLTPSHTQNARDSTKKQPISLLKAPHICYTAQSFEESLTPAAKPHTQQTQHQLHRIRGRIQLERKKQHTNSGGE